MKNHSPLATLRGSAAALMLASAAWAGGCATAKPLVEPAFAARQYTPLRIAVLPPDVFMVIDQVGDNDPAASAALGQMVSGETIKLLEAGLRARGYDVDLTARWDGIYGPDGQLLVAQNELQSMAGAVVQFASSEAAGQHGAAAQPAFVAPELAAKIGWATQSDTILYANIKGHTTTVGKKAGQIAGAVLIVVVILVIIAAIVLSSQGKGGGASPSRSSPLGSNSAGGGSKSVGRAVPARAGTAPAGGGGIASSGGGMAGKAPAGAGAGGAAAMGGGGMARGAAPAGAGAGGAAAMGGGGMARGAAPVGAGAGGAAAMGGGGMARSAAPAGAGAGGAAAMGGGGMARGAAPAGAGAGGAAAMGGGGMARSAAPVGAGAGGAAAMGGGGMARGAAPASGGSSAVGVAAPRGNALGPGDGSALGPAAGAGRVAPPSGPGPVPPGGPAPASGLAAAPAPLPATHYGPAGGGGPGPGFGGHPGPPSGRGGYYAPRAPHHRVYGGVGLWLGVGPDVPMASPEYTHEGAVADEDGWTSGDQLYVSFTMVSATDGRILWHLRDDFDLDAEDGKDIQRLIDRIVATIPLRGGYELPAPAKK